MQSKVLMQQEGPQQLTQINSMKLDGCIHFASKKCCLKRHYCCWTPRRMVRFYNCCNSRNMWTGHGGSRNYIVINRSFSCCFDCYWRPFCQNVHSSNDIWSHGGKCCHFWSRLSFQNRLCWIDSGYWISVITVVFIK